VGVLQAYVGDSIEPKDRAKALGWLSAATASGVMIGPAIGSVAYRLGPEAPGLIAAALCLINVLFAWRWLPESKVQLTESGAREALALGQRSIMSMIREVVHSPRGEVPRLIWIYAIGMLGFMSITAVLALYLQADFGVTEATIGIFFVYVGALSVVMRALVLGKLIDLFGETKVMQMGAVLLALGIFLIPIPSSVVPLGIVICLVPIGTACLFPSVSALVTHQVSKHELGQTLGVQQAFGGSARVIAPIWATAAFQGLGKDVPFYIAAAIVSVVVLLALRVPEAVVPGGPAEAI
jgi:MFS family permease